MNEAEIKYRKKGKRLIRIVVILGSFLVLFVILRVTGVFQWHDIRTTGQEPTLSPGDHLFATNLQSPERFDMVTFRGPSSEIDEVWIQRICGIAGDVISIEAGVLYIDGVPTTDKFETLHRYLFANKEATRIAQNLGLDPYVDYGPPLNSSCRDITTCDSLYLLLTRKQAAENPGGVTQSQHAVIEDISDFWNKNWNQNYFGPITVPEDHFFLLGDNRNNSMDSRYIGFVHKDDILGVVFYPAADE